MTETERIHALIDDLTQLPRIELWRLTEAYEQWQRPFGADELYVKWSDLSARLSREAPTPRSTIERLIREMHDSLEPNGCSPQRIERWAQELESVLKRCP